MAPRLYGLCDRKCYPSIAVPVERWKSGEIAIHKHIADDLIRLPCLAQRAYGQCLRELASG
jgi:hypothetical protein